MSLGSEGIPAIMNVEPAGSGNSGNNGWGGDGGWFWIVILFLFWANNGWGNNGWGNGGMNGSGAQGALTRADICSEFNFNGLENSVRGIQQGICDSTFALNNSINNLGTNVMSGFHGVDNAICNLGYNVQNGFNAANVVALQNQNALQAQLSNCCCENRMGQMQIQNQMASDNCALMNAMNVNTRDIIESQQAGTRAVLDYLCQDKISTLQAENQSLRLAASQDRQNALLTTAMTAQTGQIINALQAPTPIPAYQVPNPLTGCCNTSCGCNCGCGCN